MRVLDRRSSGLPGKPESLGVVAIDPEALTKQLIKIGRVNRRQRTIARQNTGADVLDGPKQDIVGRDQE